MPEHFSTFGGGVLLLDKCKCRISEASAKLERQIWEVSSSSHYYDTIIFPSTPRSPCISTRILREKTTIKQPYWLWKVIDIRKGLIWKFFMRSMEHFFSTSRRENDRWRHIFLYLILEIGSMTPYSKVILPSNRAWNRWQVKSWDL